MFNTTNATLRDHLQNLRSAVESSAADCHIELLFRILYGLPTETGIELAVEYLSRFLPVFQYRWPLIGWPFSILNDPYEWVRRHGCSIGWTPDLSPPGYTAYVYGFDALVNAIFHQNDRGCAASSCAIAITQARSAMRGNVWEADDPIAVDLWRKGEVPLDRTSFKNVGAVAVALREWNSLISCIDNEENGRKFDSQSALSAEAYLDRWRDSEFLLKGPFAATEDVEPNM